VRTPASTRVTDGTVGVPEPHSRWWHGWYIDWTIYTITAAPYASSQSRRGIDGEMTKADERTQKPSACSSRRSRCGIV
jgi:hypothetical protein